MCCSVPKPEGIVCSFVRSPAYSLHTIRSQCAHLCVPRHTHCTPSGHSVLICAFLGILTAHHQGIVCSFVRSLAYSLHTIRAQCAHLCVPRHTHCTPSGHSVLICAFPGILTAHHQGIVCSFVRSLAYSLHTIRSIMKVHQYNAYFLAYGIQCTHDNSLFFV